MSSVQTRRTAAVAPAPLGGAADRTLPEDFERWFSEHRGTIFRYVRFRVANRESAEDVTSEVFMKALRAFRTYNPSKAAPRTWLMTIARNSVTDHLRHLQRHGSNHVSLDRMPDLVSSLPSPEERVLREERVRRLLNAVRMLRKNEQEILSLRYGSGLRNTEIAEQLGVSANAVAVRMHRALKRLKLTVGENPEFDGNGRSDSNGGSSSCCGMAGTE